MSIYGQDAAHIEDDVDSYSSDIDDDIGTGAPIWRRTTRIVEYRAQRPLLTIVRRWCERLGSVFVFASPVWFMPATMIAAAEGIADPWTLQRETRLGFPVFASAILVGLFFMSLATWPALIPLAAASALVLGIALIPAAHTAGTSLAAATTCAIIGWFIADAALQRRGVDPDRIRSLFAPGGRLRAGAACLVLAGLWAAAMRLALPYRLRIPVGVDTALWTPAPALWCALACLLWDVPWGRRMWPRRRQEAVRSAAPPPGIPRSIQERIDREIARAAATPPPTLAVPAEVAPARLADLVLPADILREIAGIVRMLVEPEKAREAGLEPPPGIILYGPPGTGKTLIARAIAGECGRRVLAYSGAELSSKWVGESTQRIRGMFRQARTAAPCVLVLDELDGIAPSRSGDPSNSVAHRDFAQRINEILQQLEGLSGSLAGVFVVGATNHLDAIDPAVRSRLSQHIAIPLPDQDARARILRRHFPKQTDVTPEEIAQAASGLSGRDLRELCRAAALAAFAEQAETVTRAHFEAALARVGARPAAHATRAAEPTRVEPASFADLVLPAETLRDLTSFVTLLRDPERGRDLGAGVPLGAVLYGPPGTGKTLIARAIAGELGRPVLAYSGASLTSVLAGEGAQLVRDMFAQARQQAPCVLFIDEIDGVTPARRAGSFGLPVSQDAAQQINQFLQELEGVGGRARGVCVIGATNHLEALDPAVLSRLSVHIAIPLPDERARAAILRVHWPRRAETTPEEIAVLTGGLSGRDLRELCATAGMIALGEDAASVTLEHFRRAIERIKGMPGGTP